MYYKISDFLEDWDYESKATLKFIDALTDNSLNQKVTEDGRSLGFIAWHITVSVVEMMTRTGLNVSGPAEDSDAPVLLSKIRSAYEMASGSLRDEIKNKWNDDSLMVEDDMYGEKWKRGYSLSALMTHQIHHRGQMSVLMRQAGVKVPGVYGPSREEWAQWNMAAPK
jgi:uncharacterized damage-inducible protein DinB